MAMANETTLQEIINDQQPMSATKVLDSLAVNTHRHSQWTQSEHDGLAKELRAARKEAELYKYQRGVVGQRLEEIMGAWRDAEASYQAKTKLFESNLRQKRVEAFKMSTQIIQLQQELKDARSRNERNRLDTEREKAKEEQDYKSFLATLPPFNDPRIAFEELYKQAVYEVQARAFDETYVPMKGYPQTKQTLLIYSMLMEWKTALDRANEENDLPTPITHFGTIAAADLDIEQLNPVDAQQAILESEMAHYKSWRGQRVTKQAAASDYGRNEYRILLSLLESESESEVLDGDLTPTKTRPSPAPESGE